MQLRRAEEDIANCKMQIFNWKTRKEVSGVAWHNFPLRDALVAKVAKTLGGCSRTRQAPAICWGFFHFTLSGTPHANRRDGFRCGHF